MTNHPDISQTSDLRAIPATLAIVRSWRELAGGGAPTLVACSGGADSVALALALWSSKAPVTLGHVVHDLRPAEEARADRDLTRALADRLKCPFLESSIEVAGVGNDEGVARARRYRALASMAQEAGIGFVASAHHANDQLESMLMAIARGAGPEGLAGVARTRPIGDGVTLIRPMLMATRADAEAICNAVGAEWAHDLTNDDTARLRCAVREGPARALMEIRSGAPAGAVRAGTLEVPRVPFVEGETGAP